MLRPYINLTGQIYSITMTSPEAQVHNIRRLARTFTPLTPRHHPLLDPEFPEEDLALLPQDLSPRGQLQWELPKKARTNLHIMLKLSNQTDELMEEFHEKIPLIDEVLHEWAEMRGASPTIKGLEQLRAQSSYRFDCSNDEEGLTRSNDDYIFNMVRNLETPGRADTIYLTDAMEDGAESSDILPNVRGEDWPDFDGSYVHEPNAIPEALHISKSESQDCVPSNLRTFEWESDQETYLTPKIYSPSTGSDVDATRRQTGPFENFWRHHGAPFGPQVVMGDEDDDEHSPPSQDPTHLMVPSDSPKVSCYEGWTLVHQWGIFDSEVPYSSR